MPRTGENCLPSLFLLNIVSGLLLWAATIYTLGFWVRDRARGEPEKSYHLKAYPRGLFRFLFDEPSSRREVEALRRPPPEPESDLDRT